MKTVKPLATKKPPEPNDSHQIIEDFILDMKPSIRELVYALDSLVCEAITEPKYAIKWGKMFYGNAQHGWCIELSAYAVSVNIVFLNGAKLSNPPELGDETRYVKLKSIDDITKLKIADWVRESASLAGWQWQ